MILNKAGMMIEKWYLEWHNKFPEIALGDYIVMPNHFHAIFKLMDPPVRADQCVRPMRIRP